MGNDVRLADIIDWDIRNWSAALDFWTKHSSQDLSRCTALEIGCGRGGLSLWMAAKGAKVTCSDFNGARQEALDNHKSSGVCDRITYESIDATDIPYTNHFDVIVFKSMLGIINSRDLQAKAIKEMHKALKIGGELFFAENLTASPVHQYLRRRFVRWGKLWRYVSIDEMKEFLSPFSDISLHAVGVAGTLGRSERQRNALGIFDKVVLDHITPNRWKYILLGVARK